MNDDGAWDAFGSDEEDDDNEKKVNDTNEKGLAEVGESGLNNNNNPSTRTRRVVDGSVIQLLIQHWMHQNPNVRLAQRRVGILLGTPQAKRTELQADEDQAVIFAWKAALVEREIGVFEVEQEQEGVNIDEKKSSGNTELSYVEPEYDTVIWFETSPHKQIADNGGDQGSNCVVRQVQRIRNILVPGGCLVLLKSIFEQCVDQTEKDTSWSDNWIPLAHPGGHSEREHTEAVVEWVILQRRVCPIQSNTCRWLPSRYDLNAEYDRVAQATVTLTARERLNRCLTEFSLRKAEHALQQHGYCVVTGGLVSPPESWVYGQAALHDLHAAADILQERDGVQLYHPGAAQAQEAGVYRELSLREDFRVDLRSGPELDRLRTPTDGNVPRTITALDDDTTLGHAFLRGNMDILNIIRRVMNPVDQALSPGNVGRYNFSGRGPDGSFQDIRVGPVGAIISFPGAADQALHADTPHLFEHQPCLPAHYINVFTPGMVTSDDGDHHVDGSKGVVGQTALLQGTHRLDVVARYWDSDEKNKAEMWRRCLVRPRLQIGDVLLFDCRILHFGMGNESRNGIERPMLYTNVTMHWFHDPKNWDNERSIFAPGAVATSSMQKD